MRDIPTTEYLLLLINWLAHSTHTWKKKHEQIILHLMWEFRARQVYMYLLVMSHDIQCYSKQHKNAHSTPTLDCAWSVSTTKSNEMEMVGMTKILNKSIPCYSILYVPSHHVQHPLDTRIVHYLAFLPLCWRLLSAQLLGCMVCDCWWCFWWWWWSVCIMRMPNAYSPDIDHQCVVGIGFCFALISIILVAFWWFSRDPRVLSLYGRHHPEKYHDQTNPFPFVHTSHLVWSLNFCNDTVSRTEHNLNHIHENNILLYHTNNK